MDDSTSAVDTKTDALIRKAVDTYNKAVSAQEKGDWASYGGFLKELEGYLNKLNTGPSAGALTPPDENLVDEGAADNGDADAQ